MTDKALIDNIIKSQDELGASFLRLEKILGGQQDVLTEMAKGMAESNTRHALSEERIINLLERNQRNESAMAGLGARVVALENVTAVNKFARQFAPRMFFSLIGAFGLGWAVNTAIEMAGNGGL